MECYQVTQNRAAQTLAAIKQFDPSLTVADIDSAGLAAQVDALGQLAQQGHPYALCNEALHS